MDPRILNVGSSGPQSGRFTQGETRGDESQMLREHSPWNVRWIESSPTEDTTPTSSRFVLPGKGDILHATYLVMELENVSTFYPVGPNVIEEVTFRAEGDILDRFNGETIAIVHDQERGRDEFVGRDRLELNVSGGFTNISGTVIVDLPFWFRKNLHCGIPIINLAEDRHSFHIKTRVPVSSFRMIFEISDLPTQDRKYITRGGMWSLPVLTGNHFVIHTSSRENLTVRLPFTDELCGILFSLRPLEDELSGNYIKFNSRSSPIRTASDLDETSLSPIYDVSQGEILERASIKIGSMVLEDRESAWWREGAWWETGRQPPNRIPFVYGRFWDITEKYPSGGTHLEYTPGADLVLKLRSGSPDCSLLIWGILRNTVDIKDNRVILRSPFNG